MNRLTNHPPSLAEKLASPEGRNTPVLIVIILFLTIGSAVQVYLTGGIKYVYAHTMYIPITLAALFFYARGGILAALVGGLLLGPWMPVDVLTGEMQTPINWLFRIGMFLIIGGFEGLMAQALTTQMTRFQWLAQHDQESGLPNRAYLVNVLNNHISKLSNGQECGVLIFHINNYVEINNTFGVDITKTLIEQVANRLSPFFPAAPVCLLLPHMMGVVCLGTYQENQEIIQAIIRLTQEPLDLDDVSVFIDGSIGSAFYPQHSKMPEVLVRKAIIAAHSAVERGLTSNSYDSTIDKYSKQRIALIGAVPKAIEENQFRLHYQPIVHFKTGDISGMEALIRWQHPQKGMIFPGEFIPYLENTSLISPLQKWVAATAMQDSKIVANGTGTTRMAINISARSLNDPRLLDTLEELTEQYQIHSGNMVLEITETSLMLDMQRMTEFLYSLHEDGFQIAVDDFGTGFSSLSYLRSLPVDFLKLDREFIKDIPASTVDQKIVRAALALANALNIETVAEGVETQEAYQWLKAEGCDYAQGYYLSKPLPVDLAKQFFSESSTPGQFWNI